MLLAEWARHPGDRCANHDLGSSGHCWLVTLWQRFGALNFRKVGFTHHVTPGECPTGPVCPPEDKIPAGLCYWHLGKKNLPPRHLSKGPKEAPCSQWLLHRRPILPLPRLFLPCASGNILSSHTLFFPLVKEVSIFFLEIFFLVCLFCVLFCFPCFPDILSLMRSKTEPSGHE